MSAQSAQAPRSPEPRRLRGPTWLDFRLVAGVLLVLVSVLVGARVISAADRSVPVWAAAHDLAAGMTVQRADLREVQARLFDSGGSYLSSSSDPSGKVLDRPVRAGELMPVSALRELSDRVSIALPVAAERVPLGLQRGQLVDVYATGDATSNPAGGGSPAAAGVQTRLVLAAAPVQAVDGGGQGALTVSSGMRQVVVSLPSDQAGEVLAAVAGAELTLAILDGLSPRPSRTRTPASASDATATTGPAGPSIVAPSS